MWRSNIHSRPKHPSASPRIRGMSHFRCRRERAFLFRRCRNQAIWKTISAAAAVIMPGSHSLNPDDLRIRRPANPHHVALRRHSHPQKLIALVRPLRATQFSRCRKKFRKRNPPRNRRRESYYRPSRRARLQPRVPSRCGDRRAFPVLRRAIFPAERPADAHPVRKLVDRRAHRA